MRRTGLPPDSRLRCPTASSSEGEPSNAELTRALWERVYPALETFHADGTDWKARLHVRRGEQEVAAAAPTPCSRR